MKFYQYSEFWYAVALGLANSVVVILGGAFYWQAFGKQGHQAVLSWGAAGLLVLLQLLAASCVG